MKQDIEKYGLFNYEDIKDGFIEEQFELFNIKYFKLQLVKNITLDYFREICNKYRNYAIDK